MSVTLETILRNAWYIGCIHTSSRYFVTGILKIRKFKKKKKNSCFCYTYPELSAELGQEVIFLKVKVRKKEGAKLKYYSILILK